MARLPVPGADENQWGAILNTYLLQSHTSSGALKTSAVQAAAPPASSTQAGDIRLAGDLGGTSTTPRVVGLQGRSVATTTPSNNDVLRYNTSTSRWEPAAAGGGSYTDEQAQDAVGTILTDSSSIDFTYNDTTPSVTAVVLPAGIDKNNLGGSALNVANGGTGAATHGTGNVLVGAGTAAVTSTKTAPAGDFVGTTDTQALTNKTLTDATNTITATSLRSATTSVSVSAATAPSSGQVLQAVNGTSATWQNLVASEVAFSAGGFTATDVQAAISEAASDSADALTAHASASDPHADADYGIMMNGGRRIYVGTDGGTNTTGSQDGDIWIVTAT